VQAVLVVDVLVAAPCVMQDGKERDDLGIRTVHVGNAR
jgi:hypothetical protein